MAPNKTGTGSSSKKGDFMKRSSSDSDAPSSSSPGDSTSDEGDTSDTESTSSDDTTDGEQANHRLANTQGLIESQPQSDRVLVFTRSTESALRLSRLLSLTAPRLAPKIATITRSTASSKSSKKALATFRNGTTPILVATDRVSRGIDVPGLEHVVSYDVPGSALAYIHRVGRTARAGREGHAWTLVEHREGRWFWQDIGGHTKHCIIKREHKVKKMKIEVDDDDDDELRKVYASALQSLGSEVRRE